MFVMLVSENELLNALLMDAYGDMGCLCLRTVSICSQRSDMAVSMRGVERLSSLPFTFKRCCWRTALSEVRFAQRSNPPDSSLIRIAFGLAETTASLLTVGAS
jgi:hypothetical protein